MRRFRPFSSLTALAVAFAIGAPVALAQDAAAPASDPPVKAVLELGRQFYYTGDPLEFRVLIVNEGDETVANPVKGPVSGGFQVVPADGGEPLGRAAKAGESGPGRPDKLAPKGFYGTVVDLAEIYPGLSESGRYRITWSTTGVAPSEVVVQVIPRYDPAKRYEARIVTGEGTIVIDFFPEISPIAVKSFIDMANVQFYDGLLFHEVRTDDFVVGGDPMASGIERPGFRFPAEQSSLPVVAGTVLLRPVGASPPANASPFVITLRPHPEWVGQATVLGQVVSGLDIVQKISRRPSTQMTRSPHFRPLRDIRIDRVTIVEKAPAAGVSAEAGK